MTLSTDFSSSTIRTAPTAHNRKPGTALVFSLFAASALLSVAVHIPPRLLHIDAATVETLARGDLVLWIATMAVTLRWLSRAFADSCVLNWSGDASLRRRTKTVASWAAVGAMFVLLSFGLTGILPPQTVISSASIAMLPMIRIVWRNRRHV